MLGRKSATWRLVVAAVVPLVIAFAGGCATTINHAYDPSTNFGTLRSYAWAPGSSIYSQTRLIEANVQFVAEPLLETKGFKRTTATPDLVMAIRLENYPSGISESYELRMLGLNVYRADGKTLIWQGTASGSISTNAASSDLKDAVQAILATFPPG